MRPGISNQEWALFVRRAHYVLGIGFCLSVFLSPLGIWLLMRGKQQYEAIMSLPPDPVTTRQEEVAAIGLVSSWDDVAGTTITGMWEEDVSE